jgi:tetratricopeptide (TPR) repeat protein
MSGEALYERYKDALKRGHIASLRGSLDEAITAYAEAALIAPERSTPHTSAGNAMLRSRRPADALQHYVVALRLAPRDEAALLGRAQALTALRRRADAADAFDALADVQAADGRLGDAVDSARRGLELAEGRHRRRALERLIDRLRASELGAPGRLALERALQVLEGPAMADLAPWRPVGDLVGVPGDVPSGSGADTDPGALAEPVAEPLPATQTEPEEPAPPQIRAALDRDLPADVDLELMAMDAEACLESGDATAPERFLDLASANFRAGRIDAAIDACYEALAMDPDNVGLHLALVQLYERHGWTALAGEKLDLLARLSSLDDDPDAIARVAAARSGQA